MLWRVQKWVSGKNSYPSQELRHLDPTLIGDSGVEAMRERMGGQVIATDQQSDQTIIDYRADLSGAV